MKYLITGATGFTGGTLSKRLLGHGHSLNVLIRDPEKADFFTQEGVSVIIGDLTDPDSVNKAARNTDGIFHIAAAFRTAGLPDQVYYDINVEGTRNVLEAGLKNKVKRIIHCSTIGVHGHVEHPPAGENAPFNPGDIYQKTKLEGEQLAHYYYKTYNLPVVVIRPAGIYGPGDMRFLKLFRAIKNKKFIMLGKGEVFFHPVYIDDLINAFVLAMNTPSITGETFIIAGPEYVPLNELVTVIASTLNVAPPRLHLPVTPVKTAAFLCELFCKPIGLEPPLYRRRVDFFTKCRAFSIDKAMEKLGYKPEYHLVDGIRKTTGWYTQKGFL